MIDIKLTFKFLSIRILNNDKILMIKIDLDMRRNILLDKFSMHFSKTLHLKAAKISCQIKR